jgi:hypothetical protein
MPPRLRLLHGCCAVTLFALHVVPSAALEALLTFWALPMLHGLHWSVFAQVVVAGRSPSSLWARWGELMGSYLFICQIGDWVLLLLPGLVTSLYAWWEREFIALAFYDLHTQLLVEHRLISRLFHLFSPVLPIALWYATCDARVMTDAPNIGPLLIALSCVVANGPLLVVIYLIMDKFCGTVRWDGQQWTVWLAPLLYRMSRGHGL